MSGPRTRFAEAHGRAVAWLFDHALPRWSTTGVDSRGGFYEAIGKDGRAIEAPRRTRVVARQIYSFAAARRMGWHGDADAPIAHGLDALYGRCLTDDGLVVRSYDATYGGGGDAGYDFYDHAFALFALASAATVAAHRACALATAHAMATRMEALYAHPVAGFADGRGGGELRANPHMHMLEACLALDAVDREKGRWRRLADAMVALARGALIDEGTGALREVFDRHWHVLPDRRRCLIEPGHQYEWAWLLSAWNARACDPWAETAVARLAEIGEARGLAGGIVRDALDGTLALRTPTARIWPQTERVKLCVERALATSDSAASDAWWSSASEALDALDRFLLTPVAGLWHDRLDASLAPIDQPAPASTLYHIVCALETAGAALRGERAAAVLAMNDPALLDIRPA